jgi:hypothetical protein
MSITPDKRALSSKIKAAQIKFHDEYVFMEDRHQSPDSAITKKNWEQL